MDVYNANTGAWTTTNISVARDRLAATSLPAKALAFFAGGFTDNSGFRKSNVIDIFNGLTGAWTTALLSGTISCAVATSLPALDLAFFTKFGCEPSRWSMCTKFDVYSTSSVNVSTVQLPEGYGSRYDYEFAVTSLHEQNLVFFARQGSPDDEPRPPSPPSTPSPTPGPPPVQPIPPRRMLPGVAVYNAKTGNFSLTNRSRPGPRFWISATSLPAQGLALFFSSDRYYGSESSYTVVDLYNASSGTWTNMSLSTMRQHASLVSLPDQGLVLIGPGTISTYNPGQDSSSLVHIYDCSGCPVFIQPATPAATPATPASKSQLRYDTDIHYVLYFCHMFPLNAR